MARMTEQEYTDVSDLAKVRMAERTLRDICPENSKVIGKAELAAVIRTLGKWAEKLHERIETTEVPE